MSEAKAKLATAVHTAADLINARDHTDAQLTEARKLIEQANDLLAAAAERTLDSRLERFSSQMVVPMGAPVIEDGEYFSAFTASPYSGVENALRPTSVRYRRVGEEVHAEVLLGPALEGAPGRAHGGATAAMFDDVMGAIQRVSGLSGYTKTLDVSYLGPMPVTEVAHFRAFVAEQTERSFTVDAEARHDGQIVATARGVFTLMTADRFVEAASD